ncbi:MAG: amino acid--tRNA ligase-related protein, partial [Actinomycetes bacterium]
MEDSRPLEPNRYRDARGGALRADDVGRTIRLAGWVAAARDHGGLLFVDLRDAGGTQPAGVVQLVSHPDLQAFETLTRLRLESVISVTGTVVARTAETVNPKLDTGEVEVQVDQVEVLSASDVLPFPVERDTDVGEDARLRYRSLDLRRGPLVERLAQRARFAQLVRTHLAERGFLEIQTPILTASSPEGARDFLVPSRIHPGEFYALPQAPQQFKQLLMVGGVERYFQIAPCFRDEASRADRSPGEFYQIDLEMA